MPKRDSSGSGASGRPDVTQLLRRFSAGDAAATEQLLAALYRDLHAIARWRMANERDGHTLTPTALVNEAYLKLVGVENLRWESKAKFLAYASKAMQTILVDHARRKRAKKRGGGWIQVSLSTAQDASAHPPLDLDRFMEAMDGLEALSPRQAETLRLRFIVGLSVEETARAMEISERTVKSESRVGVAWVRRYLSDGPGAG